MTDSKNELFTRIEKCFCEVFGEHYMGKISAETSMDDVVEWDSLSYIDFVCELEDEFDIQFSETESAQMFQIQHITRIIDSIIRHEPLDDVKHAYAQMQLIKQNANADCMQIVILSGSSTREGFVPLKDIQTIADRVFSQDTRLYNISVSGLVVAEMLQIMEGLKDVENLKFVIGFSPIILFGCGMNEFLRSVQYERFSIHSPRMLGLLADYGYEKGSEASEQTIQQWSDRYLSRQSLETLRYSPYKYPTLKPWDDEKFNDEESILRYYNNAPLNFEQSGEINKLLLQSMFDLCRDNQKRLIFINLTLHSATLAFLQELGELVSKTEDFIQQHIEQNDIHFIDSVKLARLTDEDYRDPGHIYQHQQRYTEETLKALCAELQALELVS